MRISANIAALQKSLEEAKKEINRKLESMVQIFSYWITWQAIENTPYGDSELYFRYYNIKTRLKWFLPYEGSAKGGWTISMNLPTKILVPERASSVEALNIKSNADKDSMSYKLGDTVYIVNSVPYMANSGFTQPSFDSLENGYSAQAPRGVMEPTIEQIQNIYQLKLDEYYKAS